MDDYHRLMIFIVSSVALVGGLLLSHAGFGEWGAGSPRAPTGMAYKYTEYQANPPHFVQNHNCPTGVQICDLEGCRCHDKALGVQSTPWTGLGNHYKGREMSTLDTSEEGVYFGS